MHARTWIVSRSFVVAGRLGAIVLAVIVASLQGSAAQQTLKLSVVKETYDGQARDIAAQPSALAGIGAGAGTRRAWIAEGRNRAAFKLTTGDRMLAEDRRFISTSTLTHPTPTIELPLALEVDDANKRLWTMTDGALYVESYGGTGGGTAPSPVQLAFFDLRDLTQAIVSPPKWNLDDDRLLDFKLSPADPSIAYVLTEHRVLVCQLTFSASTWSLGLIATMDDLFVKGPKGKIEPPNNDATVLALKFTVFSRLRVVQDPSTGRVMGFLSASMSGYSAPGIARPGPLGVVACWLDRTVGGVLSPTLFTSSDPTGALVYYNQISKPPSTAVLFDVDGENIVAINAYTVGNTTRVALAGGPTSQVRILDATNCFTTKVMVPDGCLHEFWFVPPSQPNPIQDRLRTIYVDRTTPNRIYAVGQKAFWTHTWSGDCNNPPYTSLSQWVPNEPVGEIYRDMVQVAWPNLLTASTMWTAGAGSTDHVLKVFGVYSALNGNAPPSLLLENYNMSSSDGGVAIADANNTDVYVPTFGGLVRYHYTGTKFEAVPSSFVSAELQEDDGLVDVTEHVDLVPAIGTASTTPVPRVVTASSRGDFMEFKLTTTSPANPTRPSRFMPSTSDPILGTPSGTLGYSWSYALGGNGIQWYGNDITYLDLGVSGKWILTDLAKVTTPEDVDLAAGQIPMNPPSCSTVVGEEELPCSQIALLAYKWDSGNDSWVHTCTAVTNSILYKERGHPALGRTITVSKDKHWAFIGHALGISAFDISGLQSTTAPSMTCTSTMIGNPTSLAMRSVNYSATASVHLKSNLAEHLHQSVLVVWLASDTDNIPITDGSEIVMYGFNEVTGVIFDGPVGGIQSIPQVTDWATKLPIAFRGRTREIDPVSGASDVFFCTKDHLVQFRWDPTPPPIPFGVSDPWKLTYKGHWETDQDDAIQDCRPYVFPQLPTSTPNAVVLLGVKNSEGFGVIEPAQ